MAILTSALCGEIDLATADAFRDNLYEMIDQCDVPIVRVDLRAVTFIDSAGFHAFVDANEYAIRHDHLMTIRNLTAQCEMVIRLCDWDNELHIESMACASA